MRYTLLTLLLMLSVPAHAQTVPNAEYGYPYEDASQFDPNSPGFGVIVNPPYVGSKKYRWNGRYEGYALGDGLPEVLSRFNLSAPPESGGRTTFNGLSNIIYFFRVVGNGTDPFGELALVPLTMDYFVSLGAFPQRSAKVFVSASIDLTDLQFGSYTRLREFRGCASTETTGTDLCFGAYPPRPTLTGEGTIDFNVLGSITHRLYIAAQFQYLCVRSDCDANGSALLDPMPQLNTEADPASYGRPPGFRLQDHYHIEFSPNNITGPRTALLRDGFDGD